MRKPRASVRDRNAGPEVVKSLGGDGRFLPHSGSDAQHRLSLACRLDRIADLHLASGFHGHAERLAHEAAALRQAVLV
jgi:hypothetical protein